MKLGHVDALNYYEQDHESAFRIVNVVPPLDPAPDPGEEGMIRYNRIKRVFEGYINGAWSELVTDAALFGNKEPTGDGNVTKEALKNILSQLFKTSDGTIHVVHAGGGQHGDGYGINAAEVEPLPDYVSVPALAGNTIQPDGVWRKGGNNFIVCKNVNSARIIDGAVSIDFPKMFKMATGPTAVGSGGTGGEFIVGTLEGKIRAVHVQSPGTGYTVGDIIAILPGTKWDEIANSYISAGGGAVVTVSQVDSTTGAIEEISIDNPGRDYTPEEKFNYIFDVVSGLAGNSDATGMSTAGAGTDFSTHAVPAWITSPDLDLANNVDHRYGRYMFNVQSTANQTAAGGFITTCKFICTLYKYKEFSNLV